MSIKEKHNLGQYFTTNIDLKYNVFNNPEYILEPLYNYTICMYLFQFYNIYGFFTINSKRNGFKNISNFSFFSFSYCIFHSWCC